MSRISGLVDRVRARPPRSTRHKLHAVRFGRLIGSLCRLVELGDDASDKLGGDWILDRSYVASFVQRTLDCAREVVFDSAVLSGEESAGLLARLDAVRGALARLMARTPPGPAVDREAIGGERVEEPEYRLLRAVIARLTVPSSATLPPRQPAAVADLAEVLQDAHERALRSFEGLHFRSWGRRAGCALVESGFPGPLRVVESGAGVSPAPDREWRSRVGWRQVDSRPLRALLEPLASSRPGRDLSPPSSTALAILAEEWSTLAVAWPAGALVIHARLEEHAAANSIYCALRGDPPGSAQPLAAALTQSGFRLLALGPGLTGWVAGGDEVGTRTALGRIGPSLEGLLRTR